MRIAHDTYPRPAMPPAEPRASLAGLWAGWNRFWFTPSDPTLVGLIRICCGILVLYVHLVYSYDLQELFGAHAWVDQPLANDLRTEGDPTIAPLDDWTTLVEAARARWHVTPWAAAGTPDYIRQVREVAAVLEVETEPGYREPVVHEEELSMPPNQREKVVSDRLFHAAHWQLLSEPERRLGPGEQDELLRSRILGRTPEEVKEQRKTPEGAGEQDRDIFNRLLQTCAGEFAVRYPSVDPRTVIKDPKEREYVLNYARRFGIDPRLCYSHGQPVFSFWYYLTDPTWMVIAHVAVLLVITLFTIGLGTRVMAVLTWFVTVSYIQREPPMLFGQDTMQNLLLLYLMIAPSGAALSVDRLLARWWARRNGRLDLADAPPTPRVSATFAVRLIQINLCFIYFAAGCSKLLGATWWEGKAIWYTMANYQFAPLNSPAYCHFLEFLTQHRWLCELVMTFGVLHTFLVELVFPWAVWFKRIRWCMLAAAILLHAGIAIVMGLTAFQMFMLCFVLAFFPVPTIHRLVDPIVAGLRGYLRIFRGRDVPAERSLELTGSR